MRVKKAAAPTRRTTPSAPKKKTGSKPKKTAARRPQGAAPKKAPAQKAAPKKAPAQKAQAAGQPAAKDTAQALGRAAQKVAEPYMQTAKAGWSAIKEQAQEGLQKVQEKVMPPLTEKEERAAKYMHAMLRPDKLGGHDKTFNHRDVDAVADGITDRGIRGTVARGLVRNNMPKELDAAGVQRDPAAEPDDAPRRVSSKQLQDFQRASAIVQERGKKLESIGLKVVFPKGISQDAMTHLIEGRLGLPPGATIKPVQGNWQE